MRLVGLILFCAAAFAADPTSYDYTILATQRTSTMEKELNEAAARGYRFSAVMGGDTAAGGQQLVIAMVKDTSKPTPRYRLLATQKTSTMQKELRQAGEEGFRYLGQTVFNSATDGAQVMVILESDPSAEVKRFEYQLLATNKTSTMEKELVIAGAAGFKLLGMTVAKTSFGGEELVSILIRDVK